MTSAGSRAFSCRTPPRTQFTYPPHPHPPATTAAMAPPTRYYSPPTGYYRPAMIYPTAQYSGTSPSKQHKGRGKYDEGSHVMLADSTTITPPANSLSMKKCCIQVGE